MAGTSSVAAGGTNRMAGLMSGLDTESLVKAMTSKSLQRIRSRQAKQQKLTWQQEGVQSIIAKISEFQNKFLSLTSKDSVRLRSNLQKMSAVASSKDLSVTANSSAPAGTYKIYEASAAKAASISTDMGTDASPKKMSDGSVKLDFSGSTDTSKNYTVKVTVDGNLKEVTYAGKGTAEEAAESFRAAAETAFAGVLKDGQSLSVTPDGVLTYADTDTSRANITHTIKVGYSDAVGLKNDASTVVTSASTLGSISFSTPLEDVNAYTFTINGKQLEFTKDSTISSVVSAINEADAGVKASYNTLSGKFAISSTDTGSGSEISITQQSGNLLNALFNVGSDVVAEGTTSVSAKRQYDVYGSVTGTLKTDIAKSIGDGGLEPSEEAHLNFKIDGKDYDINLAEILPASEGKNYTFGEMNTKLRDAVRTQYMEHYKDANAGASQVDAEAAANTFMSEVSIGIKSDNTITLTSSKHEVSLYNKEGAASGWDLGDKKDNISKSVRTDAMSPFMSKDKQGVTSLKFEGHTAIEREDGKALTIKDLTDSGLFSYTSSGYLIANVSGLKAENGDAKALMGELFGDENYVSNYPTAGENVIDINDQKNADDTKGIYAVGSDASLTIVDPDGARATYQNASNVFSVAGLTINVEKLGSFKAAEDDVNDPATTADDPLTIEVGKDNSAVKDLVVKFVDAYNDIITTVNKTVNETRPKSGKSYYEPLTEEQKADMTSEEIEKWETEAKKGLLANDDNLRHILDDMNNAMLTVSGFTIFDMGITLSDSRSSGNIFTIDETKLDEAISKNGDKIANFFTDATNGLATKMNKAVDGMISTSTNKYGYLTRFAGVPDTLSATNNTIYNQIQEYNDLITRLQERYDNETERYWAQFSRVETMLAKFDSQAGAFTQASM